MPDGEIQMRTRVYICPLCGQLTRVVTPKDFLHLVRVTCEDCKREFFMENNLPKKL